MSSMLTRLIASVILLITALLYFWPVYTSQPTYSITDIRPCIDSFLGFGEQCTFPNMTNYRTNHVILIAVDAMGESTLDYAQRSNATPYWITKLSDEGRRFTATTTYPSTTRIAFPAMLSGSDNTDAQQICDFLVSKNKSAIAIGGSGFLDNIDVRCNKLAPGNLDNDSFAGDDDDVTLAAIGELKNNKDYSFLFVHLSLDSTCHKDGPYSKESMSDLRATDKSIGSIVSAVNQSALYKDAVIIVTADHGCHETKKGGTHGSKSPEDMNVPVIFYEHAQ